MAKYRTCGDTTFITDAGITRRVTRANDAGNGGCQEIHLHLVPPEDDDDETPVTNDELRRLVDRMGPKVRRTRVSDDEDAYNGPVVNMRDLTFSRNTERAAARRARMTDAEKASHDIHRQQSRMAATQAKIDQFWDRQHEQRRRG